MSVSWAHRLLATRLGSGPSVVSRLSARECARSVLSTTVRWPSSAQRSAVAAATEVLPTPPLPVKTRMRTARQCRIFCGMTTRAGSGEDVHGGADVGPIPGEFRLVVANPQTAVRAGVAPVAAPVVVVNAGAFGGEVLRPQYVLEEIAAGLIAGNWRVHALAGHRLVWYAPQDVMSASWGPVADRALERERRPDGPTVV